MQTIERNFRDFHFNDDVNQLANRLLPELARRAGMEFEDRLTVEQHGQLVGVLGKNKGLRETDPVKFLTIGEMATYAIRARADRSAEEGEAARSIERSLNNPEKTVPEGTPRIKTGAAANWFDFSTQHLVQKATHLTSDVTVYVVTGNREMNLSTELTNENHKAFQAAHKGQLPTEQQYAEEFVVPELKTAGYKVEQIPVPSSDGDEIAEFFVAQKPELFLPDRQISMVRTDISVLQLALQMHRAARVKTGNIPEIFMEAAARPIATNQAEIDQPRRFQAPQPALRQAALDGKLLQIEQEAS